MDDKLLYWKSVYGSVYKTSVEGHSIVYRALTAWELQALTELRDSKASKDLELSTCLLAVISPTSLPTFNKPGTISSLSAAIWEHSIPSINEANIKAEQVREWAENNINNNFNIALSAIICKVMPSIDLIKLLDMPLPKLMKIGAIVEKITGANLLTGDVSSQENIPEKSSDQATQALSSALQHLKRNKK
jgi:hypothetical protein